MKIQATYEGRAGGGGKEGRGRDGKGREEGEGEREQERKKIAFTLPGVAVPEVYSDSSTLTPTSMVALVETDTLTVTVPASSSTISGELGSNTTSSSEIFSMMLKQRKVSFYTMILY